jgi:hypothetical protein
MQEERDFRYEESVEQTKSTEASEPPETVERPVPGIKHEHEADAENIMPVEDGPGTL